MTHVTSKILLPTVDTCRWRKVHGDTDLAECLLVTEIVGSREFSSVSYDTCSSCCQSFPPSPARPNPVVASRIYAAAAKPQHPDDGNDNQHRTRLRELADRAIEVVFPPQFLLTPARDTVPCVWLGDCVTSNQLSSNGKRQAAAPQMTRAIADDSTYHCHHPRHELTTRAACHHCLDWSLKRPLSRTLALKELVPPPRSRHGRPVRRWAVGITTAPRRRPTLEACLDSVVRAGWSAPRLFLDGTTKIPPRYEQLAVTWREAALGAWPAWYLALWELLVQESTADAYLILQDDVVLYDGELLREYLEQVLWPTAAPAILSLFYTGLALSPGWQFAHGEWHWGAQVFLLEPEVARALVADPRLIQACHQAAATKHLPIPELVADFAARRGVEVWYPVPSLSQHIGNSSTIWNNAAMTAGRRAYWYAGSIDAPFASEENFAEFPEHAFPCPETLRAEYEACVHAGLRRMRESSVVICGLARDVRLYLPRMAVRLERLGQMFDDYRVVLYENDSIDAAREFLQDWQAKNPRATVLGGRLGAPHYPSSRSVDRTSWLARCRNEYRDYVLRHFPEFDFVVVIDTDLAGGFSYDGLAHTLGQNDWDVVGSLGLYERLGTALPKPEFAHADIWAFRPNDSQMADSLPQNLSTDPTRGGKLMPVNSAFGGLAVYRREAFFAAPYGGEDCEHVVFHKRLRAAGFSRQYLNPNQLVLYTPI